MATPKPTIKTVADLKTNILNPALTSTYECSFAFPGAVTKWANNKTTGIGNGIDEIKSQNLTIACRAASLPGTSLATHEMLNDFTGIRERHVYRRQYDENASFTFYVDVNYDLIFIFENWLNFIINQDSSDPTVKNPNYSYRVNFPNEYKSQIFIRKFEKDYAGRNLEYTFFDAYPSSINSMPVTYDQSGALECTVNFNFSRYVINTPSGFTPYSELLAPETTTSLPEEQKRSSVINDATPIGTLGGTENNRGVERDTGSGAPLDGSTDPEPITERQALGLDPL